MTMTQIVSKLLPTITPLWYSYGDKMTFPNPVVYLIESQSMQLNHSISQRRAVVTPLPRILFLPAYISL